MRFLVGFILTIFYITSINGCMYVPKEPAFKYKQISILETFYKIEKDTIRVIKLIDRDDYIEIKSGKLFSGDYASIIQEYQKDNDDIQLNKIDSASKAFVIEGYSNRTLTRQEVMFVQVIPDSGMNILDYLRFMNFRHDLEEQIGIKLSSENNGEWFAGDMGYGANMLFFVNQWDQGLQTILELLNSKKLLNNCLISRRIMINENDWSYEVVHPPLYHGSFYSF